MKKLDLRLLSKLGTLRQLEIFLKVAELESIARASEQLHLTQPSVSMQIKKLSEAIGLPLYEVIGKRLKLTETGREVAKSGHKVFEVIDNLGERVDELKGLHSGTLSIGVVTTAKYFIPYVLAPFWELYPGVNVNFNEGNREEIIARMANNQDDLYFFSELPDDMDIKSYPFLPNPIAVIASKKHPLATRKRLKWTDVADERFVVREAGSSASICVDKHFASENISIKNSITIQSNEAIKHAVMANMGLGIISAYILSNADADGITQLNVKGFPILSEWRIVHLNDKTLSPVADRFLQFMLTNSRDLLPMKTIEKNVQKAMKGKWGS